MTTIKERFFKNKQLTVSVGLPAILMSKLPNTDVQLVFVVIFCTVRTANTEIQLVVNVHFLFEFILKNVT